MITRFGRKTYTDEELHANAVPCPFCAEPFVKPGANYGKLIIEFECFECGATWLGGPQGILRQTNLDICVQFDQVQEVPQ